MKVGTIIQLTQPLQNTSGTYLANTVGTTDFPAGTKFLVKKIDNRSVWSLGLQPIIEDTAVPLPGAVSECHWETSSELNYIIIKEPDE